MKWSETKSIPGRQDPENAVCYLRRPRPNSPQILFRLSYCPIKLHYAQINGSEWKNNQVGVVYLHPTSRSRELIGTEVAKLITKAFVIFTDGFEACGECYGL